MHRAARACELPVIGRRTVAAAVTCGAMLVVGVAHAQNYREMPIGGRTATMGGAGTAAGNDSAMPYLNPAGLAGVPGDIVAVSATVYSYTSRSFKNFFFPTGTPAGLGIQQGEANFSTSSIGELPSSVMYFKQLGDPKAEIQHRLGVSLVIPSARNVNVIASFSSPATAAAGTEVETASLTVDSRRYYIGPTYAVGLGPDLRLGISFYGLYERTSTTAGYGLSTTVLGGTFTSTTNIQYSQIAEAFSLSPIAGVQYRAVSDLWLGLGLAPPTISITGRARINTETSGVDVDRTSFASLPSGSTTTLDASYSSGMPLRLNAGAAWEGHDGFSAAADVHLYLPRSLGKTRGVRTNEDRRGGDLTRHYTDIVDRSIDADAVVDISIGAEYAFTKILAARVGFFTDAAGVPELTTSQEDNLKLRLDRFGGTLGLGFKLGSFDTTAGVLLARGTGHYGAVDTAHPPVTPIETTETTGMVLLSGAVTVEQAKKTIRDTLPMHAVPLPDVDLPDLSGVPPLPAIPAPLPAEPKPPPPTMRGTP
jgi:hypothetical protein